MPERLLSASRIVLVGFMGAGKTSVGQLLAKRLGWGFLDMDTWIERTAGLTIARLFAERGEVAFRALERRAAAHAATLDRHVVAAGGGAFAAPDTRALLQAGATTVYLECDLDTLLRRVPPDGSRPLAGNRETMQRLLAKRETAYRRADVTQDAARGTPLEVAEALAIALGFPPS